MGFIAYQVLGDFDGARRVRIFLECQSAKDAAPDGDAISYSFAVDVEFVPGQPRCVLHGVDQILALKKFYKLVFSLEERARERGNDWQGVFASPAALVEHLDYTKNSRRLDHKAVVERRLGY